MPKTYPIASIKQETDNVQTFTFDVSLGAKPGQFVMVWLPGVDEVPMSVALDDGKQLKITFFAVGDMTKELAKKKIGDLVGLRGPFGTNYEWEKDQHLILVAGGYGAAPMFFVANEAEKDDCTIDFIVGARSEEHLLYLKEIEKLPNTTLHITTDDGSRGYKGYNTEVLEMIINCEEGLGTRDSGSEDLKIKSKNGDTHESRIPNSESHSSDHQKKLQTTVFSCGPELMMKRTFELSEKYKIECAVSLERYMKCGYGLCGNCVMDPLGIRVCVDGPVMKSEILRQLTEFGKYCRDDVGRKHNLSLKFLTKHASRLKQDHVHPPRKNKMKQHHP